MNIIIIRLLLTRLYRCERNKSLSFKTLDALLFAPSIAYSFSLSQMYTIYI